MGMQLTHGHTEYMRQELCTIVARTRHGFAGLSSLELPLVHVIVCSRVRAHTHTRKHTHIHTRTHVNMHTHTHAHT